MRLNVEISRTLPALALTLLVGCPPAPADTEGDDTAEPGTDSASETGDDGGIPAVCARWSACALAIDPMSEEPAKYGPDGACWQADDAEQASCIAHCNAQLRSYGDSFADIAACRYDDIVGTAEFRLGEAVFDPADKLAPPVYRELADGGTVQIVRGGQGLLMLPFAVRGSGFEFPDDPNAWDDPKMPTIDLWVDIEGHNVGFGGHFARLTNYPIGFVPLGGDEAEHLYIAVIVPDAIPDATVLVDQPGLIRAELHTYKQPTVVRELEFVVAPKIQEM